MTPPEDARGVEHGVIGELYWHIQDPVALWADGHLVAWNPAAETTFGISTEEALDDGFDLAQVFGEATGILRELLTLGGTAELACAGGCERRLQATVWRLHGGLDAPLAIILRDLTDDRRRMDGLARLNAIGRRLLAETSPETILQLIVEEAKAMLTADFSALLTLRPGSRSDIAHFAYDAPRDQFPERLPRCVGLLAVPIDTGAAARLDDIRGHPAGVGIPVQHPPIGALLAVPIMGSAGAVGELAVANVPDRRPFDEVDEALLGELAAHASLAISVAAGRAAERAAKDVEVSLGRMALHDLRTPIAIASGSLQALRSGHSLDDDEREELYAALERALGRIHDLTEGIARARDREQEAASTVAPVDVGELVDDAFTAVADLARTREVALVNHARTADHGAVQVDVTVAFHALENLLTNAVKHSPKGDRVTVTARLQDSLLRFDVTDNGPGLSSHDQAHVFDGRLGGAIEPSDGAGLGLSIVRRLLEAIGGGVGVSSQPGHGATFWCTVPVEHLASAPG